MKEELNYLEKIQQTAEYIKAKVGEMPKVAIVLGTGLGQLVTQIEVKHALP